MENLREMEPSAILIVGSGIAGLRAGVEATARGAQVEGVYKERMGIATPSILSHGYVTLCPEEAKETLFEKGSWELSTG